MNQPNRVPFELGTSEEGGGRNGSGSFMRVGGRASDKRGPNCQMWSSYSSTLEETVAGRAFSLTIWRVHRHSSMAMEKLTLRPVITSPGPVGSWPAFFLFFIIIVIITYTIRGAYSASLPMSVPHPERGRLCIPPPSFLPFLLLSFLPLPLASPPLVNLLINDDCKPDNAIFIPPRSFSTRDSLLLFSYIYMYICILLISIQNNDKTFSTTNVSTTLSDRIR